MNNKTRPYSCQEEIQSLKQQIKELKSKIESKLDKEKSDEDRIWDSFRDGDG